MDALGSVEFVSLTLGPTPWWNTRLHLAAALASDFTDIQQFLVFNANGEFELIAPPTELRRALAKANPKLEGVYQASRTSGIPFARPVDSIIAGYDPATIQVFGQAESLFMQIVTPLMLRELGIRKQGEAIELSERSGNSLQPADIVRRRARYLVLMRDGNFDGIVDRDQVTTRLAQAMLA
jgi:hypothetical protein